MSKNHLGEITISQVDTINYNILQYCTVKNIKMYMARCSHGAKLLRLLAFRYNYVLLILTIE